MSGELEDARRNALHAGRREEQGLDLGVSRAGSDLAQVRRDPLADCHHLLSVSALMDPECECAGGGEDCKSL